MKKMYSNLITVDVIKKLKLLAIELDVTQNDLLELIINDFYKTNFKNIKIERSDKND